MFNNAARREKNICKTSSVKKRTPSHMRVQSFDSYFDDLMSRQNNPYALIDSPHLNQRLSDISAANTPQYVSAISTPTTKVAKHLERKKYTELKSKIQKSMTKFQNSKIANLKDLFEWKQILLTQFLTEFTAEIEKECKQKGQILKYIWNSMFSTIQHISQQLWASLQQSQKWELNNSIKQHETYQKMIQDYKQQQTMLNERYDGYKITISKLIYELRFKRKEINRLYKNQKMLLNKLNEYKESNLDMQFNYIELMSSMKDLPPESAQQILKAREEITKNKNVKFKVQGNKKTNRDEIRQELKNDRTEQISELFEEIKAIATQQLESPHLISTLIEATIQNYGIFHDDKNQSEQKLIEVIQTRPTNDAGTQISEDSFKNSYKRQRAVQFSFLQKLTDSIINSKMTQTYSQFGKRRLSIDRGVDTGIDVIKRYVDSRFKIEKVCQQNIWGRKEKAPNITINPINFERNHKKHMSQQYLLRGNILPKKNKKVEQLSELYQAYVSNEIQENTWDQPFEIDRERQQRVTDKTSQSRGRSRKLKKSTNMSQKSQISIYPKKSESKIDSKENITQKEKNRSQYTTSRFKEASIREGPRQSDTSAQFRRSNSKKKSIASPGKPQYSKLRSDFQRCNFLGTNNCYNFVIDEQKQQQITSFFAQKRQKKNYRLFENLEEQNIEWSETELQNEVIIATLNQIDNLPETSASKKGSMSSIRRHQEHRVSMQLRPEDENELLMNVCRNSYFKKGRKPREDKAKLLQIRDEYTSVKDNIEMIAKDVEDLMLNKEELLKKIADGKNLKNMYKILMMTFAKAYDCYKKQIPISNLVHPLFESFSLIYGAINTAEVYKKMINFIASISVKTDNTILRFFLFFLGLDRSSPYSSHVTICQVELCLALLEKISIEGKVTLNIDSIYTDTDRIKQQLDAVLSEEKIPRHLCLNIKKRVQLQLQNSATLRKQGQGQGCFKINIYNTILLIIKEVIKGKTKLMESFTPIFQSCPEYQSHKRIPVDLLELTLSMCPIQKKPYLPLIQTLKKSNQKLRVQQFCSILFEYNLASLQQLLDLNSFIPSRWKIPELFQTMIQEKLKLRSPDLGNQKFEHQLFDKLGHDSVDHKIESYRSRETMQKLLFTKWYFERVDEIQCQIIGRDLEAFGAVNLLII